MSSLSLESLVWAVQVNEGAWRASGPTPDLYNLLCPIMGPKPQDPNVRDIPVSSDTVVSHPYLYTDEQQLDLVEAFRNASAPGQVHREVGLVSKQLLSSQAPLPPRYDTHPGGRLWAPCEG